MNRLARIFVLAAIAAAFLALPLAAQTDSVYTDDFQSNGTQYNPAGWIDTSIGVSSPEAAGLYKTWPDPTQGNNATNIVYGTKQSSGKPDATTNPRIGTFSTYSAKTFSGSGRFEYRGRFLRTDLSSRIGLTFFSSYPEKDSYYLVGLWSQPVTGKLTMQLFGFGGPAPAGTLDGNFTPDINRWYSFVIQADDSNGKTSIRARFWLATNPEPATWNIDAVDSAAGRLTSGRIGMWAAVAGESYIDDLFAKSPVDHTAPVIRVLESGQPLAEGTRFNRVPSPQIVVTDDLTPSANIFVTAQLDGQPFTSGSAVTGQGNHTLTVHAVDSVGNASDLTLHFFVDTIPPVVTVVSPKDGSMTANNVTIALQVVDASLPYKVAATLDGAAFTISNPVTAEGKHTLAMIVTDDVGLSTTVPPITFTIDKSNPVYVLKEGNNAFPANGFVFDRDISVHVDVQDLTPTTTTLTLDGAPYTGNTPITIEGDHTIAGSVSDSVGHTVPIPAHTFTIDKSAPVVTITENDVPMIDFYDRAVTPVIKVTDFSDAHINATVNGQPFTTGTTLSAEQKYTLAGSVTDSAGHSTPFGPIVFYIDLSAPVVTLTANGSPFPAGTFVFDKDVAAGITVTDLTTTTSAITLDGANVTLPLTITTEKAHKLTAVVTDKVHKSTTVTADFVIDKTAPSVDVQESGGTLQDGRYFNRKVTPVIVVTDSTATTVAATLDGQPFTSGTDVTAEGSHTIAGSVTDAANHKVDIGPVSFVIDVTKPVGVFKEGDAAFPDGRSLNRDVSAHVAVTDASPVTVTILLDGAPYVENAAITAEQSHTLSATLLDKAGNSNTVPPVSFRIDRTPPVVTLLANGSAFPADYVFARDIAADVRVEDASTTTTTGTLDGTQITFPHTITTEGQHTISATSTDAAGLATTTPAIHFTLDKTPPSVIVLENGAEAVPNKVWGVDVTVTFTIDQGASQRTAFPTLDGNPYVAGTPITAEGVHTIAGEVRSAAGLTTPIPATVFTIDKTAPVVKLLNRDKAFPASGFYFNSDVVPVVDCTDNLTHCTAKLLLNGNEVPNNQPITAEGTYTLVVAGTDEAGNTTQLDPVAFTIDKTPPAVTITSHTDGQIVTEPQAVIAGATDDAATIDVNGVAATIDFNNKTYTTPTALPLLEGENIIAVTGIDQAGNPGTRSLRVILDTRNPSLTVKTPAAGACVTDADLIVSGSVTDPNINNVSVTAGGTTVANALDATKQGFSATFPAIAEGTQNVVVVATDTKGHRTQAQFSLFVDRGTPAIDVLESNAPFTAQVVSHPLSLTLRARDLDPNVQLSATLDNTRPYVSGAIINGEGSHRVDVVASDCAGHQATVTVQFAIDTVAPVISSIVPANGTTIAAAPQAITGTISGNAVRVEIEGTAISATPAANGDFTLNGVGVAEGLNSFTLRAIDAAGNVSRLVYTFIVKSQAPKVDITENGVSLQNGTVFNRPVSPVVHSDDLDATITALLNGATYDGSPISGDGNYTIEGRATDKYNHTGSATRTFVIDMTPPAVHITSPVPGDVATSSVTVSGSAGDAVSVTVDGVAAQLSNGSFTVSGIPLDIGENTIIAAATDAAGNVGRDRVVVNVLGAGPGVIITEPADGSLTNRPRIDVAGRVLSPTEDGHITIGSARTTVDSIGNFRFNGYQLAEGDNTISVLAKGTSGQATTAQVHVTADFTPPALTVLASGQTLADNAQFPQTITITLHATDNRTIESTTLSLDGSARTAPVDVSAQGGHVLTAIARDTAGNETRVDRTFFIGTSTAGSQGCHIDSTDPVDGAVISASSVTVAGRAPGAATVTVAGVNATVADGTFTASIDLPGEGPNAVQVQCADAGGLTATRTISLIRQTGNPSIDITSPSEGLVTGDKTTTVSGTLSSDVDAADVNGKAVTISGTTFSVSGISLANGLNTLVAHARNKAGRTAADSVRVRSIQSTPDIAISSPLPDYQTGDTKVTVSGTWSNLDPATIAISGQAGLAPPVVPAKISDTTGTFTIKDVGLANGLNTLTITARDLLGVPSTSTVTVTVAPNTPSITITAPADNAYLPGNQPINVGGSFNGAAAPHIDINSNVAAVDATALTYAGTASFSTAGAVTPIVARITDANGNSGFASIRVNRLDAPFAVKEAFPAPNAQEVDTGVIVLVSFNAPLDLTTIAGAVTLKASDGTIVTCLPLVDDDVLTLAPTSLLKSGTTYTIAVATSLKNAAGMPLAQAFTSSFTTSTTAPATKPHIDPIGAVDCAKPLVITGTAPAFARLRMDAGTLVLTGSADANGKFSFTYPFNGQSGYQVARVRVVGSDGSLSPADEVSFRFDCSAPQVVGASYDRTVNTLTISFSKPVDPATLVVSAGGTIVLTTSLGNSSTGTFSASGSNVAVTPTDDLRTATFTLTVTDGVKDAGGNKLVAPFSQTFSLTGDDLPPAPGDGSGFISGEVYDASTGRPLPGANVTIIVPTTAFAKTPGLSASASGRYTVIGTPTLSSSRRVSSNSFSVAVNSPTESRGRYTLPLPEGAHTIKAAADGYTTVWRQIIVPAGAGVVPIDIRLAKRGDVKTSDGSTGISLAHGGDSVITRHVDATLPAGAVPSGSKAALTAVGAQSLAGLLPLGWSPLASAELAVLDSAGALVPHAPLGSNASITFTLPSSEVAAASQVLTLVQYDEDRDEWRVLVPVMTAGANDKWSATITNGGAFAVVYHDKSSAGLAEPPAAAGGATLQAASGTCAPCELVKKSFDAEPKTILPNGRTVATLQIVSGDTTKFPSGTAVQAYVNEELHLPGGTTLVDPPFATDVLLYRNLAGDTGFGQFYLAPSQQATKYVLSDGVDHIQILQYPGRLDRGTLIGAEGGRVPGDETVAVEIPSSATTEQLHASVSSLAPADLASYGTIAGFRLVGGFSLTMSRSKTPAPQDLDGDGQTDPIPPVVLSRPARATVAIDTNQLPAPGSLVVVAEVVEHPTWGRVIRLADPMTAIDTPQNGVSTVRYTTRSIDPAELPVDGVIREGRYLILAAEAPVAWATGAVRGSAGGAYLADTRITSFSQPSNAQLGVADSTRNTGVFAIPVAAVPAAGFSLLPKNAGTGEGTLINSTGAPAPDTVVKLGDVVLTPQSPALISTVPANGTTIDLAAPLVVTMNFSAPIDLTTARNAISVANATDGSALPGTVGGSGATVTFTPSRPLVAASRYVVTIASTVRGTNGAPLRSSISFGFLTNAIPTNANIDPLKVHITIPDNGVSRIYGDAGALPGGWRAVPIRQGTDFITRYQSDVAADGSFSLLAGNGVDSSDRITVDDVIDLDVINTAGNVAAVIRLTPFITTDGKGFIAPAGVSTTFRSVEGIVVSVPAGAFDEPKLINVALAPNGDVFNSVPSFADEMRANRTVNLTFDGVSKQRIDISFPINGLPLDRDYFLGWLGQSVWGPRVAVVDTIRIDGQNFTNSFPPDAQVKKMIASANSSKRIGTDAGLTDMQIKSCLVGVTRQGSYALMDWTMPVPAGGLGWAVTWGIEAEVELMNNNFHSIYLPDFAFSSRNDCAAMPILKDRPFTLTGVNPSTGMVEFKTSYDPIPLTDPAVVTIPSPDPDKKGPYPVFGTPFRIETIDFTGTEYVGRGYKLVYVPDPSPAIPQHNKIKLVPIPGIADGEKIPANAKIQVYNITKSRWSNPAARIDPGAPPTVPSNGQFPESEFEGDRGDQLIVYIGTADIAADTRINLVFSEPIDLGTIPTTATADEQNDLIDKHLKKTMKFEWVKEPSDLPADVTKDAHFSVDSQNRRVWIAMPAPLKRGMIYRLTLRGDPASSDPDHQFKDTSGNLVAEVKNPTTSALIGDSARDLVLEFKVRENPDSVLGEFTMLPRPDYTNAQLRDMAQSGNLAFVSALEGGVVVYDLSDLDALKKVKQTAPLPDKQPEPYSLIPARWTDGNGNLLAGANGMDQNWAVTTDHHGRVFTAGFLASLADVRQYKVEDFVKAHNDNNGGQCADEIDFTSTPAILKKANCKFDGATIVGWRPGWSSNLPLGTNMVLTDYPTAYPRKLQIATQDNENKYEQLVFDPANPSIRSLDSAKTAHDEFITVAGRTEFGTTPGSGNFKFDVKIGQPVKYDPISGNPLPMTDEDKKGFLVERVTLVNTDLDLRWSVDRYLGEQAVISGVIGRTKDHFTVIRNKMTYAIITMLGYGISIYDMRAVESNDIGGRCGVSDFHNAYPNFCDNIVPGHPRLLEKILNTRGDGKCDGTTTPAIPPPGILNAEFSPESLGYTPARTPSASTTSGSSTPPPPVFDKMRLFALDARRGVLDLTYDLPTDGTQPVAKCAQRPNPPNTGLLFQDLTIAAPRAIDRLRNIESHAAGAPRFNAQALFHWEVTAAQNTTGLRGSKPNTPVKRDYLLIAAGNWGMLIVEVGGTAPPAIPSYSPLETTHLADVIWFKSGCFALRPIPNTNLVTVLDGKGHVLIVDLSNIDERWTYPNPSTTNPPSLIPGTAYFPTSDKALTTSVPPGGDPNDVGVDDPRVIYKSPYVYGAGAIPPLVDPQTGIAFGGDSLSSTMRTAALFDPPVQVLADLGHNKLEVVSGIVPLGVEPPKRSPEYPKGALAAFRIRVTLPGDIAKVLNGQKLQFALESERMPNELSEQTPVGMPRSHLRRNKRDGKEEKDERKTDLVFTHEIQLDPSIDVDKDYRHQSGYNRLISPWIVAIADPRASEHVTWTAAQKKTLGCLSCERPDKLHLKDESNDNVYELFTNGRTLSLRPDANGADIAMSDAMKGVYKYLGEKGRLEIHIPTTMADTVRGAPITVAAQAPPAADGALSETTYVHSGELEVNAADLMIQGRAGNDLAVARTHRSRTIGSTALGMNWEAPFLRRLRQLPNGNVEYRDGMGEVWTFSPDTSTPTPAGATTVGTAADTLDQQFGTKIRYLSPKGLYLKLARNENGWMLFDRQWRIAHFDNYGRLTSISDEFWKKPTPYTVISGSTGTPPPPGDPGNTTFYAYDHTGRLTQITDSVGRTTTLEYWPEPPASAGSTTPPADYNCTALGDRMTPCKYAGLLSKIKDWRSRDVIFEYDKYGRLIGVQHPKVEGPEPGSTTPDIDQTTSFKTDDRRPRVRYDYETPPAPTSSDPLSSATYTKFMLAAGEISRIFDAAQNAPGVSSPQARVRFDYYDQPSAPEQDRRLFHQYWPCGDAQIGPSATVTCTETPARFEYGTNSATVTDMLGQVRLYETNDLVDAVPPGAPAGTQPDPQKNRWKHISKETVFAVPVLEKSAPPILPNETTTDTDLTTSFTTFDEEGGVKDVALPNGTTIHYDTLPANNGAPGRITDRVTETGGGETRITHYIYDDTNPNAANTPVKIERSKGGGFLARDAQSPSRERKTTQVRDSDARISTKIEATYDDYGRPKTVERRKDAATVGSGALVEQHEIKYEPNDAPSTPDLKKGRPDEIKSGSELDTTFAYAGANTGGQLITATDTKRGVITETEYDSQERVIHTKIHDGSGTLAETWTGYDASGRMVYSGRVQTPIFDRVETFYTLDPLGRVVGVRTTKNKVDDFENDISATKKYSVSTRTVTALDEAVSATGTPPAQTQTILDKLGRTQESARSALVAFPIGVDSTTENAKFAYDKSGQLAYTTDTVRGAAYTVHDAFGRPTLTFGVDRLQSKSIYDAWDQVVEQQALGTGGAEMGHSKQHFSDAGHLVSQNEQVNASGSSPARFRQAFSFWGEGGTKTGIRTGEVSGLDDNLSAPHLRGTEYEIDEHGRVKLEKYGEATGITGTVAPIHQRNFIDYIGDIPQHTQDVNLLRSSATVTTDVVIDGLNRIHSSTVGGAYTTVTDYDEAGNVRKVTPPAGVRTVERQLDGRGLAHREIRNGQTVKNFYDARGNLYKYVDESGAQETLYDFDPLGRTNKITYPDATTEEFRYEDKTGVLLAHKDRKNVWLRYGYDEGGRTISISSGVPPATTLQTTFEYDMGTKRLTRAANRDAAIEFRDYDDFGRPNQTVTYRYRNGTGLETSVALRQVLDVHTQAHSWSIFDDERLGWRMPVTGDVNGTNNAAAWLTQITEDRDVSTNIIHQLDGTGSTATPIVTGEPGGVGQLLTRKRAIGSTQVITSTYGYADSVLASPMSPLPPDPQTGVLRSVQTSVESGGGSSGGSTLGPVLAGSQVFHDASGRIGYINDLGLSERKSAFTYDPRGRVKTSRLLLPQSALATATPITDQHTETTFRSQRETSALLSASDITRLGRDLALTVEPPKWTAVDGPAHETASKTVHLDGGTAAEQLPPLSLLPPLDRTFTFTWEGGSRTSDGVWGSTFDEFGRLTKIENADRVIEYVYDPHGRIVGRTASQKTGSGNIPETRAEVLVGDGLPAQTTWVWDSVVDRLVAIYETGASTAPGAAPDAGLIRQYLHGDRSFDDPVEVLVAPQAGAAPVKYFPVVDEAGTDSLQAVLDKDGNVIERVLYGDAYGDAPRYLQGPAIDKITYTSNADGSVDIGIRATEKIKQLTVSGGVRLTALKGDGSVAATSNVTPLLESGDTAVRLHLSAAEWSALTTAPGAAQVQIAVTSTLRTYSWGDTAFSSVPDFARKLYPAKSDVGLPVIITSTISNLASYTGEVSLYEIKSLYMAGFAYSKTRLLTSFQALPYNEPANGLIFARSRWYDPATGTFLTPDPIGYHDASSLYAFAAGDPVNGRDPLGLANDVERAKELDQLYRLLADNGWRIGGRKITNLKFAGREITTAILREETTLGRSATGKKLLEKLEKRFPGLTVPINKAGFPEFEKASHNVVKDTLSIGKFVEEGKDINKAWRMYADREHLSAKQIDELKKHYTMHHDWKNGRMVLVDSEVHSAYRHTGGNALNKIGYAFSAVGAALFPKSSEASQNGANAKDKAAALAEDIIDYTDIGVVKAIPEVVEGTSHAVGQSLWDRFWGQLHFWGKDGDHLGGTRDDKNKQVQDIYDAMDNKKPEQQDPNQ